MTMIFGIVTPNPIQTSPRFSTQEHLRWCFGSHSSEGHPKKHQGYFSKQKPCSKFQLFNSYS